MLLLDSIPGIASCRAVEVKILHVLCLLIFLMIAYFCTL